MFSTVFIDISLIFVQLGQKNFGKTVRDPPPFITFARVLDKRLQERLLCESDIDFEKVLKNCYGSEASKFHTKSIKEKEK